ncbi:MAG TPA: DNA-formamidopyrimidine glycosylase family protein [candidate division Zixibacteria bacterium]|nr:DNA-formamidopyrimidine glycosylase family protein [candidate division Zixibacteria bacterium]
MPEGDTIFRSARTLHKALAGSVVTRFETMLPRLAGVDEDAPLAGRTVDSVTARGKWLLMQFSGDLTLLTHMLMSGSWHIYRPGEKWFLPRSSMRIVLETERIVAVCFSVQVAEFHTARTLARRPGLAQLGPDLLKPDFDAGTAIANLRAHPELEIGTALLQQSLLAGVGNVFKSEVCFGVRIHPFRKVASISDKELAMIVATAERYLRANIVQSAPDRIVTYTGHRRTTGRGRPQESLWVYGRAGEPCRVCGSAVEVAKQQQDARVTFWCPACQPFTAAETYVDSLS